MTSVSEEKLLQGILSMLLCILLIGWLLKRFRQPYFVAYIIAGVLLGPNGLKIFGSDDTISQVGALGLIIQMFFIGTEVQVPPLLRNGRPLVVGTSVQLLLSGFFIFLIGAHLNWPKEKTVLFTFAISLSSSAIILEYLRTNNEIKTRLGTITTGILILQDLLFVPMMMVLNFLSERSFDLFMFVPGSVLMTLFILFIRKVSLNHTFRLPVLKGMNNDHELQVFVGLLICFGFAWLTSVAHLSAALGAMLGGMVIGRSESTKWLEHALEPFRVFFLSFFFLSIGLQIDYEFIVANSSTIALIVLVILVVNSFINAVVFRVLGESWRNSVYAGALLSQIGEFSLVLCSTAASLKIVDKYSFQFALAVISITMLLTTLWIKIAKKVLSRSKFALSKEL